jgi:hypothetical protein
LYSPYGGQHKALCVLQMLELGFLAYKSGFESITHARITGFGAENEDIYRDGGRERFRSYELYKTPRQ